MLAFEWTECYVPAKRTDDEHTQTQSSSFLQELGERQTHSQGDGGCRMALIPGHVLPTEHTGSRFVCTTFLVAPFREQRLLCGQYLGSIIPSLPPSLPIVMPLAFIYFVL